MSDSSRPATAFGACETVIIGIGLVGPSFENKDPAAILGKRGLRYKDESTRLAMAAAQAALSDAGIGDSSDVLTAVIVSSNHGNLDTVCRIVGNPLEPGERGPMDLPNASSNVIASSIAIRFGLFGPNLMFCSGSGSGLDALDWAGLLLQTRRAARVLVVGVEVDNPAVARFAAARADSGLFHGAACVVVELGDLSAPTTRAALGRCARDDGVAEIVRAHALDRWYTPDSGPEARPPGVDSMLPAVDIAARLGAASGALGVVQAALAAATGGISLLSAGGSAEPLTACLLTSNSVPTVGESL